MTEFSDFTLAPMRKLLGPVYDKYRKAYEYNETAVVPGNYVSTLHGTPLPDVLEDRKNKFHYSVYGRPDNPVPAGIVGVDTIIKMQSSRAPPTLS